MVTANFEENPLNHDYYLKDDWAEVYNFTDKTSKKINENYLISFLNFNKEFQELEEKTG